MLVVVAGIYFIGLAMLGLAIYLLGYADKLGEEKA